MISRPLTEIEKQLPYADFYDQPSATVSQAVLDCINSTHDPNDALLFENLKRL